MTTVSELVNLLKANYQQYFGPFCVKEFVCLKSLIPLEDEMRVTFKSNLEFNLSEDDEAKFKNTERCWMCEQPFLIEIQNNSRCIKDKIEQNEIKIFVTNQKVRVQCQITRKTRRAAHAINILNTRQRLPNFFPFALHKSSNYDADFFFNELFIKRSMLIQILLRKLSRNTYHFFMAE